MPTQVRLSVLALAGIVGFAGAIGLHAQNGSTCPRYAILQLDAGSNLTESRAVAVNNSGDVIANAVARDGDSFTDVGVIFQAGSTQVASGAGYLTGLNDRGDIVGSLPETGIGKSGVAYTAAVWRMVGSQRQMTRLGFGSQDPDPRFPTGVCVIGYLPGPAAINNAGTIVGTLADRPGMFRALTWDLPYADCTIGGVAGPPYPPPYPDPSVPICDPDSYLYAINSSRLTLGLSYWVDVPDSDQYPSFAYVIGDIQVRSFRPITLNDAGVVLGWKSEVGPALWTMQGGTATNQDQARPLDDEADPYVTSGSLNNARRWLPDPAHPGQQKLFDWPQVVGGGYSEAAGGQRAFLWEGKLDAQGLPVLNPLDGLPVFHRYDLNDLIGPGSGWTLTGAADINEAGLIAGSGTAPDGAVRAYLLAPVALDKVSFYSPDGYHDVWQDKGVPYTYPAGKNAAGVDVAEDEVHWERQGPQPRRYPFCYESGKKMRAHLVRLSTTSDVLKSSPNLMIRGVGVPGTRSEGYDFAPKAATFKDGIIEAKDLMCAKPFPASTVDYFGAPDAPPDAPDADEPLRIIWQLSVNGGATWGEAGRSENPVFVTLTKPVEPLNYKFFRTVLYLACKQRGADTPEQAVANTWSLFVWRTLRTWNGRSLYYYKPSLPATFVVTTSDLLRASDGNGECFAFAQLFQDALYANGVQDIRSSAESTTSAKTQTGITIIPSNLAEDDVLVIKTWTFGTPSYLGPDPYQWKMIFSGAPGEMVPPPRSQDSLYGDLSSLPSIPGQNSGLGAPAEKVFNVHHIVKYGNLYYDPSYGETYDGVANFIQKALDGLGAVRQKNDKPNALRVKKPGFNSGGSLDVKFNSRSMPHTK